MRKLAIFAILALLGLLALLVVEGPGSLFQRASTSTPIDVDPDSAPSSADTPISSLLPDALGDGRRVEGSISPLEPLRIVTQHGPRVGDAAPTWPEFVLDAGRATPTRDGTWILERLQLEQTGRTSVTPVVTITAPTARARLGGTTVRPDFSKDVEIELEDSQITLRDPRGRLASVTLIAPRARGAIREGGAAGSEGTSVAGGPRTWSFATDDAFQLRGESVRGSGIGFSLRGDADEGLVRIERSATLDLSPGVAEGLKQRLVARCAGPAEITSTSRGEDPGLTVVLTRSATIRLEPTDAARFEEVSSERIRVDFATERDSDGTQRAIPRRFDAEGSVVFRTDRMEGRSEAAEGSFADASTVRNVLLSGPYRIDMKLPGGAAKLPGGSAASGLLVTGSDAATATLVDAATDTYTVVAMGRPTLSFLAEGAASPGAITADRVEARLSNGVDAFDARGNVEVRAPQGRLTGEQALLQRGEDGAEFFVVRGGERPAELVAAVDPEGAADSAALSVSVLARSIRLAPKQGRETEVRAEGDATGRFDSGTGAVEFRCDMLTTDVGGARDRSVTLLGSVFAKTDGGRVLLEGDRLVVDDDRSGSLTGAPARLSFLEEAGERRVISAPTITLASGSAVAEGGVEVRLPLHELAGDAVLGAEELVLGGSRLVVTLDASRRPSSAVLLGPIRSAGDLEVRGDRLVLDLALGRHSLFATEGTRTRVAGSNPRNRSKFAAESPRFDFDPSTETVVMGGGGSLHLIDVPLGRGRGSTALASLRFDSSHDIRLERRSAVFTGRVRVQRTDAEPWSLDADRIEVLTDEEGKPTHVLAAGAVVFDGFLAVSGSGEELRFDAVGGRLVILGGPSAPAVLRSALGRFQGDSLSFDTVTKIVESGPATIRFAPEDIASRR